MSAQKKSTSSAEAIDLYDKLIKTNPEIERKGATNPYTSFNGNMFTHLDPSGTLSIRLPEKEREAFLKKYKTTLHESHGIVQKEYVTVPAALLRNTKDLKKYLDLSYEYVKTLRPKPSKKS